MKLANLLGTGFALSASVQLPLVFSKSLNARAELPIVDLGYVKQQASSYNATGGYYVFKNIRFAAPPLGARRFQKPEEPLPEEGVVDGAKYNDTVCHQGSIVPGVSFERGTEDCLFLDVFVPEEVLNNSTEKAPVLGWWHGGAYIVGAKDWFTSGNPAGLIARSKESGTPIIYVAANYRLSIFGWLFGTAGEDAAANAGQLDVLQGMDWVKEHIGKFGGDCDRFTVMGESAGGGVVSLALVSYGGEAELPFQQAIPQSPAWVPEDPSGNPRQSTKNFLYNTVNCTSFSCLQSLPSSALLAANTKIAASFQVNGNGIVAIGPVIDGELITDQVHTLLTEGKVNKVDSVLTTLTRHEAAAFYMDTNVTETFLEDQLKIWFPNASQETYDSILAFYPDDGSELGSYNRAVDWLTDYLFACPARWTADAFSSENSDSTAWKYIFNIPPAGHGSDVEYTFGPGYFQFGWDTINSTTNANRKRAPEGTPYDWHQQAIIDYVINGKPGDEDVWPEYERGEAVWLNTTEIGPAGDPWAVGDEFADEVCGFYAEMRQFE